MGIGTCCCECETGLNYVYVRPGIAINLQILRFVAQVNDSSNLLLNCSYTDLESGATLIYQSTSGGQHHFRQYNQWNGYDPGDRPPLNSSITDITLGISTTFESIPGVTYLQKARIEYIEFRRISGASPATDYTYRYELNGGETKLVKVSGTCGCIKRFAPPQTGQFGNLWVYPPNHFSQLRVFTGALGFDPVGTKSFTMTVAGLTSPWDVLNFSGATLSYVSGGADFEDGFTFGFRFDGSVSGKSITFECQNARETNDVDVAGSTTWQSAMGYIQITDGSSHSLRLVPSNLDMTTKQPDLGSDWSAIEWREVSTYSGFGTAPDASAVVVTITETP